LDYLQYRQEPLLSFTTQFNTLARQLISQIEVCEAFTPPSQRFASPLPPGIKKETFRAIWDTGATGTVITQKVVDALGLLPTGRVNIAGIGTDGLPNIKLGFKYIVNIILPNKVVLVGVTVSCAYINDADVLIGMDIIRQGDFAITNVKGKTCLSFRIPSSETIDFNKDFEDMKRKFGEWKPNMPVNRKQRRAKGKPSKRN